MKIILEHDNGDDREIKYKVNDLLVTQRGNKLEIKCSLVNSLQPKFKVNERVFATGPQRWGRIICAYSTNGYSVKYETHPYQQVNHANDNSLTAAPTWLEEFGDNEAGRKRIAHLLIDGERKVEVGFGGSWAIHCLQPFKIVEVVIADDLDYSFSDYRFAPETDA